MSTELEELLKRLEPGDRQIIETALEDAEGKVTEKALQSEQQGGANAIPFSIETIQSIIDLINIGVVVHSSDSTIISCNSVAEKVLGLSRNQLLGIDAMNPYWHLLREDGSHLPNEDYPIMRVLRTEKALQDVVLGIIPSKDLEPRWLLVSGMPTFNKEGSLIAVFNTFMDITGRKKAEAELAKSKTLLDETGSIAKTGGWSFDVRTKKQSWTKEVYNLHEVPENVEPTVNNGISFFPGESGQKIEEAVTKAIKEGEPYDLELRFVTMKGNKKWVRTRGQAYYQKGKIVKIGGFIQDITQKKEVELALKKREKELEIAVAAKDKLLSIIAHDLRNPFHAIIETSNLLRAKAAEKDFEKIQSIGEIIHSSSKQAYFKLNDLLEWANLQTGRIHLEPESLEMRPLLKDVFNSYEVQFTSKQISVDMQIPDNFTLTADRRMLKTVLENLLSNAIKFTERFGSVTIRAQKQGSSALFSVEDTGTGIPEDEQENIFLIEKSKSKDGTENEKGTGLGLILCKEFIDYHNGKLWVESTPNAGSTFYVLIPQPTSR